MKKLSIGSLMLLRSLLLLGIAVNLGVAGVNGDEDRAAEPTTPAEIYGQGVRDTEARTPDEERAGFHLPDGFEAQLFAAEPLIAKPLNMAWDARGRLWITNTVEYPYPAKEGTVPRDSIKILEDTNGDGQADKVTTFADKLNIPMGLLPTENGVICFNIPNIVLLRDNDGDDRADETIKLLGPFDTTRDTHGMINALRRGADGWIYACHGFNNQSQVTAADGSQVKLISGNTFRFREDGSRIEQVSQGQVNPFGMTIDEWGSRYTADCHSKPITAILTGGCYPSFGRAHDGLGFAPAMMDHLHGSTAICGLVYYQADQFPQAFRGRFFSGNVMTSRINCNALVRNGATVTARELPDFMTSDDPWFRPVDIQLGPDGSLYVADFYNKIIGHYEVPLTHPERDRERGRIWRITYRGRNNEVPQSLTAYSQQAAAAQLLSETHMRELASPNVTRRELAIERTRASQLNAAQAEQIRKWLLDPSSPEMLRLSCCAILWSCDQLSSVDVVELLNSPSPRLQVEALRAASQPSRPTQSGQPAHQNANKLMNTVRQVLKDSSEPQVKLAAVQALGRIGNPGDLRTLLAVAKENQDKDPTLRQAARISLRDLLRNHEALEVLISSWRFGADKPTATRTAVPLDDSLAREVASILPALDSELASEGLLSYVDAHSDASGEIVQAAIDGAAKHLNSRTTEALLRVVRKINGDDPIANAKMLDKICAAIVAKNLPYPPAIQAFTVEITANLSTKIEQALSASDTLSDWRDARGADWGSEERKCQDGQAMMATSSLSRGEAYVGTLVSSSFAAPAELEFWLCGHNGLPTEPDKQKNFVRLVHAQSGQVLQTAFPPRNDTAQRVDWDLDEHAGAPVRLELVDTDNAGAYAWLAVGRFSLGGLNRSQVGEQLGALNPLIRRRISTEVTEHVQGLAQSEKLSPRVRAELIGSIAEALQIPVVQAIAEQAIEMDQAVVVSSGLIAVDAIAGSEMTNQVLQQISLASTARQQSAFAGRLLRSGVGCSHLVELLDAGKLSLASLRGRELLLPESCSEQDRARLMELAKQASALPDQNSQLVQERLTRLQLDTASVEQGKLVFEKSCAICHQLGGKGTLIGPQLDGAGRRGAERLCEDILDPHRNVDKAFRSSTLLLADDKVVTGLVREQADGSLQVIGQDGKSLVIPSSNVDQRRDSEKSLMPDNFAEVLNDSDLAALLKYLTAAP